MTAPTIPPVDIELLPVTAPSAGALVALLDDVVPDEELVADVEVDDGRKDGLRGRAGSDRQEGSDPLKTRILDEYIMAPILGIWAYAKYAP